jgi:hypothetical protein
MGSLTERWPGRSRRVVGEHAGAGRKRLKVMHDAPVAFERDERDLATGPLGARIDVVDKGGHVVDARPRPVDGNLRAKQEPLAPHQLALLQARCAHRFALRVGQPGRLPPAKNLCPVVMPAASAPKVSASTGRPASRLRSQAQSTVRSACAVGTGRSHRKKLLA